MSRHLVLVVDPDPQRREQLRHHLSLDFRVVVAQTAQQALQDFESLRPDIVAAHIRQDRGHGLGLCRALRQKGGGEACLLVVSGRPDRRLRPPSELRDKWQFDLFVANELTPMDMTALIWQELTRQRLQRRESIAPRWAIAPSSYGDQVGAEGIERPEDGPEGWFDLRYLRRLLQREFYLFAPPRRLSSLSELSWFELMNSRASLGHLRELVKRARLRRAAGAI